MTRPSITAEDARRLAAEGEALRKVVAAKIRKMRTIPAAVAMALVGCGSHDVPTYDGMALYSCPAWSPDDIAASLDGMLASLVESGTITDGESTRAHREIERVDVSCEPGDTARLSSCGDADLWGGCFMAAPTPFDRHEIRLPVGDLYGDGVEDLCESFLVVEATKVVAWSVGLGATPIVDGWDGWREAAWVCAEEAA